MSYLQQLISNSVLITALIGWFAAQVLKMILVCPDYFGIL